MDQVQKMCYGYNMAEIEGMKQTAQQKYLEAQVNYFEAYKKQIASLRVLKYVLLICGILFLIGQLISILL